MDSDNVTPADSSPDSGGTVEPPNSEVQPRRGRTGGGARIAAWAMIVAGVLILAGTAWVGWRSYQAYTHLNKASADVSRLQSELKDIGTDFAPATAATIGHLQQESAAARSAVDDPLFRAATFLPWLGPNLGAVRQVTVTLDDMAVDVMPSLADLAQVMQPGDLAPKNGFIDLKPIQQASSTLQRADDAVVASRAAIDAIDRSALVRPVGEAVQTLSNKLASAGALTATGARAARLLPPMLGADGARDYLVVFQNLAEARATGGMFGSFALVHVDNGKITVADNGTPTRTLGVFDPPIGPLSADQRALYGDLPGTFPADVNLSPDFPFAASTFAKMYTQRTGRTVDGLMAIDPVALSYLMRGTGPVDAGEGVTLTSKNVVSVLLSGAYQQFDDGTDQGARDAFLARAAAVAFTAVSSGAGDAEETMKGLLRAGSERRLLLWSADPKEQAELAATPLGGQFPQQPGAPTIGLFLNDGTGGKMSYYLHNEVSVTSASCTDDGLRRLQVTLTLHSSAPPSGLPDYVTGPMRLVEPYSIRTNVSVFAPVGGRVEHAVVDGVVTGLSVGLDGGTEVGIVASDLKPGGTSEIVFSVLIPATAVSPVDPELVVTPGVNPWAVSDEPYEPCRAPASNP